MPTGRWELGRLVDDVSLLGRRGLPREQLYAEVSARLRRVIDCDATCWHTLDPQTRLMTSDAPDELINEGVLTHEDAPDAGALLVASEHFVEDVNTFAGLASRRVPVGILSHTTAGRPERSPRYRDLLSPSGIPFEMRAAFVSRGRCWGAVHMARREHRQDFTARDARSLAGVSNPEIARALVLSPFTVQDHIKSLFEKTGVSSRQELVARVFLDDYMPRLAQRTPLTSSGSFTHSHAVQ